MANIIIISGCIALAAVLFALWQREYFKHKVAIQQEAFCVNLEKAKGETRQKTDEREKAMNRRMYELAILKELGERVGYSLNIQKIIDIITGSLHQFIEYSAVSYMLLGGEKIIFKVHLEKSVARPFIDEVRDRMLKSLSALLEKEFKKNQVEEILSGAILLEDMEMPVQSFFNIPLIIQEKVVGILTVAHTVAGLYKEDEMTILYKITQQASRAVTRLQEVVEMEQRKLNAMVESIGEGVVMTDRDYRVLVVNPAAKKLLRLQEKKEISIFDLIDHLEGKFDIRGKLEEAVKLDKLLETPEVVLGDRFFQIFVGPVKSQQLTESEILGGVVIFHDITHDKELEKLREDFTAMMVHELRSPLTGIKSLVEVILEIPEQRQGEEYLENLHLIQKSSSDMLELVNDLLDVAKLEAGKFEIQKEPSNIKQLLEERMNFFMSSAKEAKINLRAFFDPAVETSLMFDPQRIGQVINNLLSNALKYTPTGGKVSLQMLFHKSGNDVIQEAKKAGIQWLIQKDHQNFAQIGDSVIVAVTDSGAGISAKNISGLFNKFKQFEFGAVRSEKRGTGLGLAIAKGLVDAHKGTIGVASQEGAGSTFYFSLPVRP